jgi:hypothetical protein
MKMRDIKVDETVWEELSQIKLKMKWKSINNVLKWLLNGGKYKKEVKIK